MRTLAYLLARFSEPSSYAGLGAVLALVGYHFNNSTLGALAQFLAAGCGLLALGLKERGLISAIILVLAVTPLLSACAAGPQAALTGTGSAYLAANKITEAASSYITAACADYVTAKAAAKATIAAGVVPNGTAGKIRSIERFGDAACAHPPAGDPLSTAIWLARLSSQISSLTSTVH